MGALTVELLTHSTKFPPFLGISILFRVLSPNSFPGLLCVLWRWIVQQGRSCAFAGFVPRPFPFLQCFQKADIFFFLQEFGLIALPGFFLFLMQKSYCFRQGLSIFFQLNGLFRKGFFSVYK